MTEWISCEERLPSQNSNFLGTDGKLVFAAYWCRDSESYKVGGWESCCYCGGSSPVRFGKEGYTAKIVTHWMPLPEPPRALNTFQK